MIATAAAESGPAPSSPGLAPPLSAERPEEWIDKPLSLVPEEFRGKSYRQLAMDEKGRIFLVKRTVSCDGGPTDPFAVKVLSMTPHTSTCTCAACTTARSLVAVEPSADKPASTPVANPTPAQPAPVAETPRAGEPKIRKRTRRGSPSGAEGSNIDDPKVIDVEKRARGAGDESAEAALEAAKRFREVEAPLAKLLSDAEAREDQVFEEEADKSGDALLARIKARAVREDVVKSLMLDLVVDNAYAAAWGAKHVLAARDHCDAVKREAAAMVARAERTKDIAERVVAPKIYEYAKTAPRASAKSVRFPCWAGRITFRWAEDDFDVYDETEALRSAESTIGIDDCISKGIIKVREELSHTGLVEHLMSTRQAIPGTKFVPAHDEPTIYRK